ncbi:peptidyl-tRNA hydrolase [Plasmodiophora brassicae]
MVDDFKGDAMEQDAVDALLPLGFDEAQIRAAYRVCGGQSIDAVAEYLISFPTHEPSMHAVAVVDCKLVLVVNTDLVMTPGKIASQCAHAALGAVQLAQESHSTYLAMWQNQGEPIIVCKRPGDFTDLALLCNQLSLPVYTVQDAGRTQVKSGSETVLAIGPSATNMVDEVTGNLKLL